MRGPMHPFENIILSILLTDGPSNTAALAVRTHDEDPEWFRDTAYRLRKLQAQGFVGQRIRGLWHLTAKLDHNSDWQPLGDAS